MPKLTNDERYEAKYTEGEPDECWPWTAATDKDGYGIFWGGERYPHNGVAKMVKATRYGWERLHGPIPPEHLVCHSCDNPPCQNPRHWFLGTNSVNVADMMEKGRARAVRGEQHYLAQLSDAEVEEARSKYTGAYGQQTALAREYGISRRTMARILTGHRRLNPPNKIN